MIQIGGRADFQHPEQEGFTFRDNLSFTNLHWNGDHLVKIGAKLSFQKFSVGGTGPNNNPQFEFTFDPSRNLDFLVPELVSGLVRKPQLQGEHDAVRIVCPGRLGGEPSI